RPTLSSPRFPRAEKLAPLASLTRPSQPLLPAGKSPTPRPRSPVLSRLRPDLRQHATPVPAPVASPMVAGATGPVGALSGVHEFYLNLPPENAAAFGAVKNGDGGCSDLRPEELERVLDELVIQNFAASVPASSAPAPGYGALPPAQITPAATPILAGDGACPSGHVQTVDDLLDDFAANSPRLFASLPPPESGCAETFVADGRHLPAESCIPVGSVPALPLPVSTVSREGTLPGGEPSRVLGDTQLAGVSVRTGAGSLGGLSPSVRDPLEDELAFWHLQQGYECAVLDACPVGVCAPVPAAAVPPVAPGFSSPSVKEGPLESDLDGVYATPKSTADVPFVSEERCGPCDRPLFDSELLVPPSPVARPVQGDDAFADDDKKPVPSVLLPLFYEPSVTGNERSPFSSNATEFVCDHPGCGRAFARRFNLGTHQETHLPGSNRRYRCDKCAKAFSRKHDLGRHVDS
ncbi:MAG: hypothetical protein BJ554DRAFT_1157, partial [Olpidium bornovanus]